MKLGLKNVVWESDIRELSVEDKTKERDHFDDRTKEVTSDTRFQKHKLVQPGTEKNSERISIWSVIP